MKKSAFVTLALSAVVIALATAGCKGQVGPDSFNLSGAVLSKGQIIGGSLTVASNTVSVGGTYAQGETTNTGSITVGK